MNQDLRDVNLHRTHVVTGAAKRGGIWQTSRMLQSLQLRSDDRANRPLVNRPVSMSASLVVHGTSVQARPAPNAVQSLAAFRISQHPSPAVIEQNNMKLLWPIARCN